MEEPDFKKENLEKRLGVVVIKPEALQRKNQIVDFLRGHGLSVVSYREVKLPERFISEVMYPDLSSKFEEATMKHYEEGPSGILILQGGEDVLQKIISLTGENLKPNENKEGTLRHMFGEHFGRKVAGDAEYFRNAVHRPKTKEELKKFLEEVRHL